MLRLSLRDFRPHVAALQASGLANLSQQIALDYLDAYARGLNQCMTELREIVTTNRETLRKT